MNEISVKLNCPTLKSFTSYTIRIQHFLILHTFLCGGLMVIYWLYALLFVPSGNSHHASDVSPEKAVCLFELMKDLFMLLNTLLD